jgi:hypothetical protein
VNLSFRDIGDTVRSTEAPLVVLNVAFRREAPHQVPPIFYRDEVEAGDGASRTVAVQKSASLWPRVHADF